MYSSLSTPRGAGIVPLLSSSKNTLPIYLARGRKLIVCAILMCLDGIEPYLPRERPETVQSSTSVPSDFCIDAYQPREGSGTSHFECRQWNLLYYRHLSTSRGAGNRNDQNISSFWFCIDTYLPREGPETVLIIFFIILHLLSYRYLSTSRGAGNPFPTT